MVEPEHPSKLLLKARQAKPQQSLDDDDLVEDAIEFLHHKALFEENCDSLTGRKGVKLKCSCWKTFLPKGADEDGGITPVTESVASYMVYYCRLKKQQQQSLVLGWLRNAEIANPPKGQFQQCKFNIPLLIDEEDDFQIDRSELPLICKSTMMKITGCGISFWKTCSDALAKGSLPKHGLKGRPSNRRNPFEDGIEEDLSVFFGGLKDFAVPIVKTGTLERDADTEKLLLPEDWSKRGLYKRFCWERGWKIKTTAKGTTTAEERTDDDWPDEGDRLPICSWRLFHGYWKQYFPELVMRKLVTCYRYY
jgi:hypothetical protein